jgi:hypothetical protein
MNVEIGTKIPIFLFWEYLFRNFGILSLQCVINLMVIVTFPFSSRILAVFTVNTIFNLITTSLKSAHCAAKAFYSCPAIISRRPGSQDTPKESQLNSEEDSRIKQARSHVTLEKSS